MRAFGLLFTLLTATAVAAADGGIAPALSVKARAISPTAKVGEVFEVEVMITHDSGQRYELKPTGDLGAFDFVTSERTRRDGSDSSTTTFVVKLQAFELGVQTTPPLVFEVTEAAGMASMTVNGSQIEIVSSLPADAKATGADLYDIQPPLAVPVRTWRVLYALLGLLAAGLAGWALLRYLNRPRPVAPIVARPVAPLHSRALSALDNLSRENLPAQGRIKEFYFRLSEIMRGYLGERYAFDARESTTPELLNALRSRSTPGLPFKELSDFAHQSDFVRYAKADVPADDCKVALELAYRIVHGTTAVAAPSLQPASPVTRPPNAAS